MQQAVLSGARRVRAPAVANPLQQMAFRALVATTIGFAITCAALWPRGASAQSTSIPAGASYSCDFENGYCDFAEQSAIGDAPPSTERRSTIIAPGRSGSHAVRLHTEPGDNNVHGSGTWERDDLSKPPDASYCNEGQEEWWAVSVMYPSDYSFPAPGQGGVFIDFHHNSDSGLPNFSIEARGESGLRISGYGGAQLNGGQYRVQIADPYGAVNNVTRNVWYDYVLHIRWSSSGNGLSEAWLNGSKILSYSGATLYSGISCYLKIANYHDATGQPSSIIYDRIVRGTSAAAVALEPLEGVGTTGAPVPPTVPPVTSPPPSTTSPAAASATMDSSAYSAAPGQSLTITARFLGNGGTPTGVVSFASDGAAINGCSKVSLSSGAAQCSTNSLASGQHKVTAAYSGDSTYGAAMAGPITLTIAGSAPVAPVLPVSFGMDSSSYTSVSGKPVTFTATIPGSGGTVAFKDNGAAIAGCASSTVSSSGIATCVTSALTTGAHAITGVYSGSGSYSAGIAGPITQMITAAVAQASDASVNVQGLWWRSNTGSESGWGINFTQQGSTLFSTWFTYDTDGSGMWLVMPNGQSTGANAYAGTLYRTTGPAFNAATFDPSSVQATPVGTASFSFSDANNGTFTAVVNGTTQTKSIAREVYAASVPSCSEGGSQGATPNYQDLWWHSAGSESGWGMNITHQGDTLFVTWFTYDATGKGMWLVASNVAKSGDGTYSGALYRTTGPAYNAQPWDPSQVQVTTVGSVSLAFSDASNGTFTAVVDGTTIVKPITREVFMSPPSVCS